MLSISSSADVADSSDVGLGARPIRARFEDSSNVIWLIVDRHSSANAVAISEAKSLLTFSNGASGDHVVFQGTTAMVDDRAKLKAIWDSHADIRFPKGATDPGAALMKFEPQTAAFWEGGSDILSFVVNYLEAKMTGEPQDRTRHGQVSALS